MLSQEKHSWLQLAAVALLTGFMAACTSGGDIGSGGNATNPDDPNNVDDPVDPDDPDAPTPGATVASIALLTSSNELRSDADQVSEGVTLTALARDANNNLIPGVTIQFSAPLADNVGISITRAQTDASGTAEAILTTAGDARNRTTTVTARAGSVSDSLNVFITGSSLTVTGADSIGAGETASFVAALRNAGGEPIQGETVTVTSDAGNTIALSSDTTFTDGEIDFQVTGDVPGADTITVTALGIVSQTSILVSDFSLVIDAPTMAGLEIPLGQNQPFEVSLSNSTGAASGESISFTSTRGSVASPTETTAGDGSAATTVASSGRGSAGPAIFTASGPGGATESIAVEFVATTPAAINTQASPTSVPVNGSSQIRAIVRDPDGNLVKNQDVDFSLTDPTGGSLSAGSARTDSQGLATVTFTAGSTNSGSSDENNPNDLDDVSVTATVRSAPTVQDTANISVGGQALRITIGSNNVISEVDSDGDGIATEYLQEFAIVVTDPSGNAPPSGTTLRTRVVPTRYRTGSYELFDTSDPPDGTPDVWDFSDDTVLCQGEDVDLDGVRDDGEDVNGSSQLEPFAAALIEGPAPTINENGIAEIDIIYPQSHNGWTEVNLTVTATVTGTESFNETTFFLQGLAADFTNVEAPPPGQVSPYGSAPDGCNPG